MPQKYYGIIDYYLTWLCEYVINIHTHEEYLNLIYQLYSTEFSEETAKLIKNDQDRIEDGKKLREIFIDESIEVNYISNIIFPFRSCSVLELIIGIAMRMDYEIGLSNIENNTETYFWELMDNLGLMKYNDDYYTNKGLEYGDHLEEVDKILYKFMNRKYKYDGFGGLFPLQNAEKDQRNVEIWYQLSSYLMENYPI